MSSSFSWKRVGIGFAVTLVLIVGLAILFGDTQSGPVTELGSEVVLRTDNGAMVFVAITPEAMTALNKAIGANDQIGCSQLMTTGTVALVASGTSAKLIENGFMTQKVRILSGPYACEAGWVVVEHVRPVTSTP